MAGLLKAIENGYKPSISEIINELDGLPKEGYYNSGAYNTSKCGASTKEELLSKIIQYSIPGASHHIKGLK